MSQPPPSDPRRALDQRRGSGTRMNFSTSPVTFVLTGRELQAALELIDTSPSAPGGQLVHRLSGQRADKIGAAQIAISAIAPTATYTITLDTRDLCDWHSNVQYATVPRESDQDRDDRLSCAQRLRDALEGAGLLGDRRGRGQPRTGLT